jgi:hypothetical protein
MMCCPERRGVDHNIYCTSPQLLVGAAAQMMCCPERRGVGRNIYCTSRQLLVRAAGQMMFCPESRSLGHNIYCKSPQLSVGANDVLSRKERCGPQYLLHITAAFSRRNIANDVLSRLYIGGIFPM